MNWQQLKNTMLFVTLLMGSTTTLLGQKLYPGDVNNNGIVNGVDFLYLANAYDQTGTAREVVSTVYRGTEAKYWNTTFPNGIDHCYADCNGDGKVNYDDIADGIVANFGKIHGSVVPDSYSQAAGNATAALVFKARRNNKGTMSIDIELDGPKEGIADFYGITFDVHFAPNTIPNGLWNRGGTPIDFLLPTEAWFAENPSSKRHFSITKKTRQNEVVTSVGISRIDGQVANGQGTIGQVKTVIIIADVDLFRTGQQQQPFKVKNVLAVKNDLSIIPLDVKVIFE
ncbi:MAG: dockerin type I domain-containing protein [Bacteroidota bacterium]